MPRNSSPDLGQRAVNFIQCLEHVKGDLAKTHERLILQPWQADMVRQLFGVLGKDGLRKIRTVYCEVPRKNGKTTLAAGILLYMLLCDDEPGAEVYSAASTREQASIVYEIAASMVRVNPDLAEVCKVLPATKRILFKDRKYVAVSSDKGAPHGMNPHCVVFDEVHLQRDRDLWAAFATGMGARSQPLMFAITTAGCDRSSLCWDLHQYAKQVASGELTDETFLPVLFGSDPHDDWTDETVWERANPCLDVSVSREFLRAECRKAQENPAAENEFRRLYLNQWTEQETRIIRMRDWDDCEQEFTEADLIGRQCFAGLDLASTKDITALVLVFPDDDGGCQVLPWFWMPEEAINERTAQDQRTVRNYQERGFLQTCGGNSIDQEWLSEEVHAILKRYKVGLLGFDGWNAEGLTQRLQQLGFPHNSLVKLPQSFGTYNEPFKAFLGLLSSGKFGHNGNPVLRWMAANVAHREDPAGNIRPDKGRSGEKIDGICAMLMAMKLWHSLGDTRPIYSTKGSGVVLF